MKQAFFDTIDVSTCLYSCVAGVFLLFTCLISWLVINYACGLKSMFLIPPKKEGRRRIEGEKGERGKNVCLTETNCELDEILSFCVDKNGRGRR